MTIEILKDCKRFKRGIVIQISDRRGELLIKQGIAKVYIPKKDVNKRFDVDKKSIKISDNKKNKK